MNYLYYNICLRITIAENVVFNVCKSIHIEDSTQVLTNTAKVELPREFRNASNEAGKTVDISGRSILDFIKRGDAIKIEFGYDDDLQTEFQGYLTKIGADVPLVLECEDEMYQLKKAPRITKSVKSGNLKDVLKAVVPSKYGIVCDGEYTIGKWLIDNATPYEVLEELRTKLGLRSYFSSPDTLHVGMTVDFAPQEVYDFNFSQNVRRGSDLKFERKEDRPLEVTAKSKQKNGEELTYTTGEKGGDTFTLGLPQLTMAQLKIWAKRTHSSRSFTGFEGTLNGWCYPRTRAGNAVNIYRPYYPDKHQDGRYFIESVTIDINASDGIKRAAKLGYKL
jgi:hypothetical protein